jgi:hypothetical protein
MTVTVKGTTFEVDLSNSPDLSLILADGDAPTLTLPWGVYRLDEFVKSHCDTSNPMFSMPYAREEYMEEFCNADFKDFQIMSTLTKTI